MQKRNENATKKKLADDQVRREKEIENRKKKEKSMRRTTSCPVSGA
jgi:hypothetical protein